MAYIGNAKRSPCVIPYLVSSTLLSTKLCLLLNALMRIMTREGHRGLIFCRATFLFKKFKAFDASTISTTSLSSS